MTSPSTGPPVVTVSARARTGCGVAVVTAYGREDVPHRRWILVAGGALGLLSLAITAFGIPAE